MEKEEEPPQESEVPHKELPDYIGEYQFLLSPFILN